jgi:lipoate-protein ligase A
MLFDSDLNMLGRVLVPDFEKINSKALRSVRARVVNLCEYFEPKISVTEFLKKLKTSLFEEIKPEIYEFSEYDLEQINIIKTEKYENPAWLLGTTPKFSFWNRKRFPAGKIEVFLDAERGNIKSCRICGDFLGILPIEGLEAKLAGRPHDYAAVADILKATDLRPYLGGIKAEELLECLF